MCIFYQSKETMKKTTERLQTLQNAFKKSRVLDMQALQAAIGSSAPATIHRYLKQIDYLTSYTHNGKYYTLPEIAQFDENGFWYYGDIGFSVKGTLIDTLAYVITISNSGQTNSELEQQFRTRVQVSLRTLLESNRIARKKVVNHNLYISPETFVGQQQIDKRQKIGKREKLPPWIIAEILIACVHTLPVSPNIEEVMKWLKKKGSSITKEQVVQVFEEEELKKKFRINSSGTYCR